MDGIRLSVERAAAGTRLDRWLAARLPDLSRARLQALIDAGHVRVGGARPKASRRLAGGETIEVEIPAPPPEELLPEPMALQIVHEDAHVLVLDKPAERVVDAAIGRHPRDRTRIAVLPAGRGRPAVTRYRVLERFREFTLVEARLETGRTHQIRVHLASLGHPVAGDPVYAGRVRRDVPVPPEGFALHAAHLAFDHPASGKRLELSSPLPARIERLLSHLRDAS